MPENIRALIVILILGSVILFYFRSIAVKHGFANDHRAFSSLWYTITIASGITGDFWAFLLLVTVFFSVSPALKQNSKVISTYILLALIVPPVAIKIPGVMGINHFGYMSWYRYLILILLVPYFFKTIQKPDFKWFNHYPDKYVVLFCTVVLVLEAIRTPSPTDMVRISMFRILDFIVPYYSISRGLKSTQDIRKVLFFFCVIMCIASLVAMFEATRSWHLYTSISESLEHTIKTVTDYKYRAGFLRAGTLYGPIPSGGLLAVGFLIFYFFFPKERSFKILSLFMLMGIGILATLSRGPWVAFIIALCLFVILQKKVMKLIVGVLFLTPLVLVSPIGDDFLALLPGVGTDKEGTIHYRQDLLETSIGVIEENPLFGSRHFMDNPKMQHLIQGEGIIDIVNTYLQIALWYGLIALASFIALLIFPALKLYSLSRMKNRTILERDLCHLFIAMIMVMVVTIATVSSLGAGGALAFVTWTLVAMSSAYIRILTTQNKQKDKVIVQSNEPKLK
ncbi:MAG: hypothetical protein COB23_09615 [Methylophaga sp.]|nr:MAG: hypothetical protein COB23_09615 [Methylophaga sp.]